MPQLKFDNEPQDPISEGLRAFFRGLSRLKESLFDSEALATDQVRDTQRANNLTNAGCILINKGQVASFDTSVFNRIYSMVLAHDETRNAMLESMESVRFKIAIMNPSSLSWEELLRRYMTASAKVAFLSEGLLGKCIMCLRSAVQIMGGYVPHPESIALAAIWGAMLSDFIKKSGGEPVSSERDRISAFCVALLTFMTQVCHREAPIWSFQLTVYKAFADAGDFVRKKGKLYRCLFPDIDIDESTFPNWHKNLGKHIESQGNLTMTKAINIHYTFRIGDIFISRLKCPGVFSSEIEEKLATQLSPVPTETELKRLFLLYTQAYIY